MKLLVTGAWNRAKENLCLIQDMGHEVLFLQQEKDSIPYDLSDIDGVICNGLFLHHPIEKFTSLKFIQLTSAGFDRVPMDYVRDHEIEIFNARGVYSIPMAEFALCGVLQLYKKSRCFYDNQTQAIWEKQRDIIELNQKNVLIVGCGSVGTECAKRFAAFGCHVNGVDLYPYNKDCYKQICHLSRLDDLLPTADIVVLTLPLTDDTKHLINETRLSCMKHDALIVNIARGEIINQSALIAALSTSLGGAVLDVFEEEPLDENNPLWSHEKVIVTPHNSFIGTGNQERLAHLILSNLKAYTQK